ncbi:MAG: nucleoside deaminase [Ruminococcaceae bacterium]|nr:nucleoside deaminase [Oscillospiraceae bacterium]
MNHEHWMRLALAEAGKCADSGDIPVGCVIVCHDEAIAFGHNRREADQSALGHAEMMAIGAACRKLGSWRLSDCDMYVTLEPCPMCAGAILNARIRHLYFGAEEVQTGSCGSVINLFEEPYPFHTAVSGGILEQECAAVLRAFFENLRQADDSV